MGSLYSMEYSSMDYRSMGYYIPSRWNINDGTSLCSITMFHHWYPISDGTSMMGYPIIDGTAVMEHRDGILYPMELYCWNIVMGSLYWWDHYIPWNIVMGSLYWWNISDGTAMMFHHYIDGTSVMEHHWCSIIILMESLCAGTYNIPWDIILMEYIAGT